MSSSFDEDSRLLTAPWNFSWIVPDKLAAMAWPQTPANIRYIYSEGIRHLVTLSPEKRPPLENCSLFTEQKLKWTEIGVEEFEAPRLEQITEFINICKQSDTVGVHCRMGRGRTGVMVACYLVHFYDQTPERAVINARIMRPGSVETHSQERVVKLYHDYLRYL